MLQDRGGLRPGCIVETEVTALGEGARCAGDRGGGGEVREGLPGRRCGATDQRVLIGRQTHGETGVLAPSPFAGCCLAAAVTAWQRGDGSGRTVMRLATGCAMDPPDQIGIQCCLFKVDRQGPCGPVLRAPASEAHSDPRWQDYFLTTVSQLLHFNWCVVFG